MKFPKLTFVLPVALASLVGIPAAAEIVYTPTNISIPSGNSYNIDLNHDGINDFTLRSTYLEDYCQTGDGYLWSLNALSSDGNAVVAAIGRVGSGYVSALQYGVAVNAGQGLNPAASLMALLYWGFCGTGMEGEWLNLPDRYLGVQFQGADGASHYGWAKIATTAYVDRYGVLHAVTILSGFAYETVPGKGILAGQRSDTAP
jgi:hypothetical protein